VKRLTGARWPRWSVALLALIIASVLTLRRVESTFNVNASTEYAEVVADSFATPRWALDSVMLLRASGGRFAVFTGGLQFAPGVRVRVERVSNGPLRVIATGAGIGSGVATLFDADGEPLEELETVMFVVNDIAQRAATGRSITMPLLGRVELGHSPGEPGRALLRSGSVSVLGRSLLGQTRFSAGSTPLEPGDWFFVDRPFGPAAGFIRVDERPALTIVFRALGSAGTVRRFGSTGFTVSASMRDRLLNDTLLQGIWLTTVVLIGLVGRLRPSQPGK
jgi:hypothetical protein